MAPKPNCSAPDYFNSFDLQNTTKNDAKRVRVATYSRVSTSHHDQKPEVQVNELRRYCVSRGWEISYEIVDHGYSGGTVERPGLKQLLNFARSRVIDVIVVVKLDRLFRSLKHLVVTMEEFQSLGVQFVATQDAVDWTTPTGKMMVQFVGMLAELERGLCRDRTLMGLAHARAMGKRLGRPPSCDRAKALELRAAGLSYRKIAKALGCSMGAVSRALEGAPKSPRKDEGTETLRNGGVGDAQK